jgi:Ni/Co efflux regulator RcnB
MNHKNLLTALVLAGMCSVAGLSHAAEEPSVQLDRPGAGVREIKKGDNVPEEYQRPALAIQDWKAKHLKAPGEHEQWVEIKGKFALVDIPTGTIKEMVNQ